MMLFLTELLDTSIRAIGKRAHPLHVLSSFSIQCILVSSTAYVQVLSFCAETDQVLFLRMIVKGEKFIIPDKLEWLGLFLLIGIFGFLAQVCI